LVHTRPAGAVAGSVAAAHMWDWQQGARMPGGVLATHPKHKLRHAQRQLGAPLAPRGAKGSGTVGGRGVGAQPDLGTDEGSSHRKRGQELQVGKKKGFTIRLLVRHPALEDCSKVIEKEGTLPGALQTSHCSP